ncbi:MAG: hypothetical protein IJ737_03055 [Ruminococcus sp.]|nr:hypothetical protein [Ruminococcus sp.]
MDRPECDVCGSVPECFIRTPQEYLQCLDTVARMCIVGAAELVYESCPLNNIFDENNQWRAVRYFHQFRCRKCGTIYGMLFDVRGGGQIKVNHKVFDPADYPDPPKEGAAAPEEMAAAEDKGAE